MKVYHKEFEEMRKQMEAWCDRQEREGWQNPAVKKWATFVKLSLWGLAHNEYNPPYMLAALAEHAANLEHARSAHTSHVG